MQELVLVADIGGTNTRFALAERDVSDPSARPSVHEFHKSSGDAHECFADAVRSYLDLTGANPHKAVLAAAGPVIDGEVEFTNRDWSIKASDISTKTGIQTVTLINDFVAMARSAPILNDSEQHKIRTGVAVTSAPLVVAGPGTGLGMAMVSPLGADYLVLGGEGGHQAFSPQSQLEFDVWKILHDQYGYVSNERVCAGMAFEDVFKAMCAIYDDTRTELQPAEVLELANAGDKLCRDYCQLRANVAMTAIGDTALSIAAKGGVWIAGGVALRLKAYFETEEAIKRFASRGRMSSLMEDIPIYMISSDEAALIGAAAYRPLN